MMFPTFSPESLKHPCNRNHETRLSVNLSKFHFHKDIKIFHHAFSNAVFNSTKSPKINKAVLQGALRESPVVHSPWSRSSIAEWSLCLPAMTSLPRKARTRKWERHFELWDFHMQTSDLGRKPKQTHYRGEKNKKTKNQHTHTRTHK